MVLQKYEDNSKFGYLDNNQEIIIPAKYEEAKEFKNNLAIVKYNSFFGLINSLDEIIIDFNYTNIEEKELFFKCEIKSPIDKHIKICWFNDKGIMIYEGEANVLSENYLCVSKGKKFGVIDKNGIKIINCLYDEIVLSSNFFIVLWENKIGLYDFEGIVIVDTICDSIESVVISNNSLLLGTTSFLPEWGHCCYPNYCKEYFYDPKGCRHYNDGSVHDLLYREKITTRIKRYVYNIDNQENDPIYSIYNWTPIKDIKSPMIISSNKKKMLFLQSEGIIPNSEFDDIEQITQICYVVKRNELYGVFRIDTKELIIPIKYNSIRFYGGHTVLVCKDNLWGALSLILSDNKTYERLKVSIPTKYYEIKILDDFQHYFGCKIKSKYSDEFYYSIVNNLDESIFDIDEMKCDSQFVFYDRNHIMSSQFSKYGFISIDGYKTIPFKYDEINERKDGYFNVRIDNKWGILNLEGREMSHIKYKNSLPQKLEKNEIVIDAESESYGVIDTNGIELIPTIYEHLKKSESDSFYYFGYGGYQDNYCENFFSGNITEAIWGVVNNKGRIIIDAKYNCFRIYKDFILAGRDGGFIPNDDNGSHIYCPNFGGVYDLYNMKGELLMGGFSEFFYNENKELYIFFWGGEWKETPGYDDDWNNIHISNYKFKRGNDLWLILDKDFKTIIRNKDGNSKTFEKGFRGEITVKKENNKVIHIYNMPIEYMAKGFSHVGINSVIINDNNSEFHKSQAIDIKTGEKTKLFSKIEQITDLLFFFAEENQVGITNINSEYIIDNCIFITYPVGDFIFIAKKTNDENYEVLLYKMNCLNEPIAIVINEINMESLVYLVKRNSLKIDLDNSLPELKSILITNDRYFNEDFKKMVTLSNKSRTDKSNYGKEFDYLFSNDFHFLPEEPDCDEQYDEEYDYMQDTWDAMTDGMYGDMPEGFNGDFDFLGR